MLLEVFVGGDTSDFADAKPLMGVARATRGVLVLVCNPDSNFIQQGYPYRNKTDASGTPYGIPLRFGQKKTPKGSPNGVQNRRITCLDVSRWVMVLFPGGSYPHHTGKITICQPKTDPVLIFFKKKVTHATFPVDLHTYSGYTWVVGLDYSSASRQLTSLTCSNRAM